MRILNVSTYDTSGGAAIAAYRLHRGLRAAGHDSRMLVARKFSDDWTVDGPVGNAAKACQLLKLPLSGLALKLQKSSAPGYRSISLFSSGTVQRAIDRDNAEVVNLHWINDEFVSIEAIGRIRKPLVWTLHDMWPMTGASHYTDMPQGVLSPSSGGDSRHMLFDFDRWVWRRKQKAWCRPIHIVTPSRWLADCARQSVLLRDQPVSVIPNPIDIRAWDVVDKVWARSILGLPQDVPLVLFGAMGGTADPRKGFDLLEGALQRSSLRDQHFELVIFGQSEPRQRGNWGRPVHFMGRLGDEVSLRLLYGACDVMVIPSRQDNLPNTGVEAQACGLPVVAFDVGGLRDIVRHEETGFLACEDNCQDLARGIEWVLGMSEPRARALSAACRSHALSTFSQDAVVRQYLNVYQQAVR